MAARRPTTRKPAGKTPGSKPRAAATSRNTGSIRATPAKAADRSAPREPGSGLFSRGYMFFAHAIGGGARALGPERIAPEDRRDGFPFAIFLMGVVAALEFAGTRIYRTDQLGSIAIAARSGTLEVSVAGGG